MASLIIVNQAILSLLSYFIIPNLIQTGSSDMTTPVPERRVAFAVAKWSHPTSVLAWAWLRQYFLDVSLEQPLGM